MACASVTRYLCLCDLVFVLSTVYVTVSGPLYSCDTVCMMNINTVSECLLGKYPLSIFEDLNAEGQTKDNYALPCLPNANAKVQTQGLQQLVTWSMEHLKHLKSVS